MGIIYLIRQKEFQKRLDRMKSRQGTAFSGVDPEMLSDGIYMVGYYVEGGVVKFADISKKLIEQLGVGIKPYIASFYDGVRRWPGVDNSGMSTHEEVDEIIANDFQEIEVVKMYKMTAGEILDILRASIQENYPRFWMELGSQAAREEWEKAQVNGALELQKGLEHNPNFQQGGMRELVIQRALEYPGNPDYDPVDPTNDWPNEQDRTELNQTMGQEMLSMYK